MAVQNAIPSGKKTASGQDIYVAPPTKTDVARQVAASRVQTFSGTTKLSDTQRVKVQGPEGTEWVTPEKALATQQKGTIAYREAEQKQAALEQKAQTIAERYEAQFNQPKQTIQERVKQEEAKPQPPQQKISNDPFVNNPYSNIASKSYGPSKSPLTSQESINQKEAEKFINNPFQLTAGKSYPRKEQEFEVINEPTLSIASKEQVSVMDKIKLPLTQLSEGFKEGIFFEKEGSYKPIDEGFVSNTRFITGYRSLGKTAGIVSAIGAFSYGLPKAISTIWEAGSVVKSAPVISKFAASSGFGKLAVETSVSIGQGYTLIKGFELTADALSGGQTKQILPEETFQTEFYGQAINERKALFFSTEGKYGVVGRYGRGFLYSLVPSVAPQEIKDVFSQSIIEQSKNYGLTEEETRIVSKRAERRSKALDVGLTTTLLGAESFANLIGGTYPAARTTTRAFSSRFIPGVAEASVGTVAMLEATESRLPTFIPQMKNIELLPAYDSLTDINAKNQYIDITQEEFNRLGIAEGKQTIPLGTNIIYNVMGEPVISKQISYEGENIIETTTTETPITTFTLSTKREAQIPSWDLSQGLFVYKGKQKQFVPSKSLIVGGTGVLGGISAGLFGALEFQLIKKFKTPGGVTATTLGYTLDVAEAPGDFVTPIFTSGARRTGSNVDVITVLPNDVFLGKPSSQTYNVQTNQNIQKTKKGISRTQTINIARTQEFNILPTRTNTKTFDFTNAFTLTNTRVNVPATTNQLTNVKNNVLTSVNTNAITDVFNIVNTNQLSNQVTKANAMTDVNTNVNTNVNTFVPTPKIPFFFPLDFFGGETTFRRRKRLRKQTAYTPDFIASVLNQYGPAPKKTVFTGQERRYKVKGRGFVSPVNLRKKKGIFGLVFEAFGG